MKKTLYSILMVAAVVFAMSACSNGDYVANPASNANNSVNPLNPLDSAAFTWGGTDPMSANINGGGYVAKVAQWKLNDTTGADEILCYNGFQVFHFYLLGAYGGKIYSLGYKSIKTWASYEVEDTAHPLNNAFYYSYLGNSGEIQILENSTSKIRALFYFQGVSSTGAVFNFANGYFKVNKY